MARKAVRRAGGAGGAAERALDELYAAPLSGFTAERKRAAGELKAAGDASGGAAIARAARPSLPAWVVNRLWREERADMDRLFAAGARIRAGDARAWEEQRAVIAGLQARGAELLRADRHAAAPATLRRVQTTLQSLSATGAWAPDEPGRLVKDRAPPGFEVLSGATWPEGRGGTDDRQGTADERRPVTDRPRRAKRVAEVREEGRRRAAEAERERAERKKRAAARKAAVAIERRLARLRTDVERAEEALEARRDALREAEEELQKLREQADADEGD